MRLKPVEQGQARDVACSMAMLGKGSATAGLLSGRVERMVVGARDGGRRLWQTRAVRRRQVSQNGRRMVPPVWHRDPCALCFT